MSLNLTEKSFAAAASYNNFYAGGDIAWSANGELLYCLNNTELCIVQVATGQIQATLTLDTAKLQAEDDVETDTFYAFALSPNNALLCTAHRSGLLRLWCLATKQVQKLWKAQHKGPVVKLQFSACGQLICSSGADSTLRLWNFQQNHCVAVLRDFVGPAQLLQFHPDAQVSEIYAAGADHSIYCWNYAEKTLVRQLRAHISQLTDFCFDENANELLTVSCDKVLIQWRLSDNTQLKVMPIYEELVGVAFVSANKALLASKNGKLLLANLKSGKISTLLQSTDYEIQQLLQHRQLQQLAIITTEQNMLLFDVAQPKQPQLIKQLIGFNDEILDLCLLGDKERYLAMATNSKTIKVYDTEAQMNCKLLTAHTQTVLTLSSAGNLLLSAGKDFSICLWQLQQQTDNDFEVHCLLQQQNSHTSSIGCLSFGYQSSAMFASVCQNGSMKVWQLQQQTKNYSFNIKYAALAHDKEINSVCFAPNNKMLATASQDKTIKIWQSDSQTQLGTLRGHTRGVWCVRFSPADQVVLSASSDCTLRLWSLANMSCLKRFEQESTVLRAEFLEHGKFIVSSATDGLIKLWSIKTNACMQTLDAHDDRIWTLAVSMQSKKHFYSAGADSKLVKWQDNTELQRNAEIDQRQAQLQEEQTLQTLLQQQQHQEKAFLLALRLNKPRTSYKLLQQFVQQRQLQTIEQLVTKLDDEQCGMLLEHVKAWSSNSRHCQLANLILQHILIGLIAKRNEQRTQNVNNLVEVLTPYVQRHFNRYTELLKDVAFLEFMVQCM